MLNDKDHLIRDQDARISSLKGEVSALRRLIVSHIEEGIDDDDGDGSISSVAWWLE